MKNGSYMPSKINIEKAIVEKLIANGVEETNIENRKIREALSKDENVVVLSNKDLGLDFAEQLVDEENDLEESKKIINEQNIVLIILGNEENSLLEDIDVKLDIEEIEEAKYDIVNVNIFIDSLEDKILIESKYSEFRRKFYKYLTGRKIASKVLLETTLLKKEVIDIPYTIHTKGRYGHRISVLDENAENHIFTVKLTDILGLYKYLHDDLFEGNLRFRVKDAFDVDNEISKTLKTNPNYFWSYNNGITIKVIKGSLDFKYPNLIKIKDLVDSRITVVNGAQTISSGVRLYYDRDLEDDTKKHIEDEAYVILKIVELSNQAWDSDFSKNVTISLNRQKPISIEDIAFTLDCIDFINKGFIEKQDYKYSFGFVRRGEFGSIALQTYNLEEYARVAIILYENRPGAARTYGRNTLLRIDNGEERKFVRNIFPEFNDYDLESDYIKIINNSYKPLNYSMKITDQVFNVLKDYSEKKSNADEDDKNIASYGRYFISYILINFCISKIEPNYNTSMYVNNPEIYKNWDENCEVIDFNKLYDSIDLIIGVIKENWAPKDSDGKLFKNKFESNHFKRDTYITAFFEEKAKDLYECIFEL